MAGALGGGGWHMVRTDVEKDGGEGGEGGER